MKKVIALVTVFSLIIVILQSSFFESLLGAKNINFGLAFSFGLFFSLRGQSRYYGAFLVGVLQDLLGLGLVGLTSLVYILFMFFSFFVRKFVVSRNYINLILVFLSSYLYDLLFVENLSGSLVLVWRGIATAALSFAFYLLISSLTKKFIKNSYFVSV